MGRFKVTAVKTIHGEEAERRMAAVYDILWNIGKEVEREREEKQAPDDTREQAKEKEDGPPER